MLWASPMLTVWAVGCVLTLIVSYAAASGTECFQEAFA